MDLHGYRRRPVRRPGRGGRWVALSRPALPGSGARGLCLCAAGGRLVRAVDPCRGRHGGALGLYPGLVPARLGPASVVRPGAAGCRRRLAPAHAGGVGPGAYGLLQRQFRRRHARPGHLDPAGLAAQTLGLPGGGAVVRGHQADLFAVPAGAAVRKSTVAAKAGHGGPVECRRRGCAGRDRPDRRAAGRAMAVCLEVGRLARPAGPGLALFQFGVVPDGAGRAGDDRPDPGLHGGDGGVRSGDRRGSRARRR